MIRIMWETRRRALEPPKKSKNSNQRKKIRQSSKCLHTSLCTSPCTGPRARDLVLTNCPRTSPHISPRTGLRAEISFSPTVLIQLRKTC